MGILRSKLARNLGLYAIGNALNGAIPFLLLPFLTAYLSKAEYGILANLELILGLCMPLIALNTGSGLGRLYFDRDKASYSILVFNYMLILITVGLATTLLLFLLDTPLSNQLNIPENVLWIIGFLAIFKQLLEAKLTVLRVVQKPIGFSILRILSTAFDLTLSVLLVMEFRESWEGRFYGQVLAYGVFGIISILLLIRNGWITTKYDKASRRQLVSFGSPLIPHAFGAMLLTFGDRFIITDELGIDATGLYFVGYQVGMIMSLIQTSFNQAWSPWFYEQLTKEPTGYKVKIVKAIYFYSLLLFLIGIVVYLAVPLIFDWLIDAKFANAEEIVFWILLGYVFNGMYKMMVNFLLFLKKTVLIGIITAGIAVLNILLNLWLVPEMGIEGAAIATTISFLVQLLVVALISMKNFSMPWLLRNHGE